MTETQNDIPLSFEEFSKFFQFHSFEILSEKVDAINGKKDVPYKKFVQMHREIPWAQDILICVSKVCRIKNSYKKLIADLDRRNMIQLHFVCMNVSSSNCLPFKHSSNVQKCCITGKWYENCLDISRTYNHQSISSIYGDSDCRFTNNSRETVSKRSSLGCGLNTLNTCNASNVSNIESSDTSSAPSPCTQTEQKMKRLAIYTSPSASPSQTLASPALPMLPVVPENLQKKKRGRQKKNESTHAQCKDIQRQSSQTLKNRRRTLATTARMPTISKSETSIFVAGHFEHFVHMLWTMSKLDLIVKNYTLSWFFAKQHQEECSSSGSQSSLLQSKKVLLSTFCKESSTFQEQLYMIFLHAVDHVTLSLNNYLEDTFLSLSCIPEDATDNAIDNERNNERNNERDNERYNERDTQREVSLQDTEKLLQLECALQSLHKVDRPVLVSNSDNATVSPQPKRMRASTLTNTVQHMLQETSGTEECNITFYGRAHHTSVCGTLFSV